MLNDIATVINTASRISIEYIKANKEALGFDQISINHMEKAGIRAGLIPMDYMEKCCPTEYETAAVKFFTGENIALKEWRRFGIIEGQLKSTEAERQIYELTEGNIKEFIEQGFKWRIELTRPIFFHLDRAFQGDFLSFDKLY